MLLLAVMTGVALAGTTTVFAVDDTAKVMHLKCTWSSGQQAENVVTLATRDGEVIVNDAPEALRARLGPVSDGRYRVPSANLPINMDASWCAVSFDDGADVDRIPMTDTWWCTRDGCMANRPAVRPLAVQGVAGKVTLRCSGGGVWTAVAADGRATFDAVPSGVCDLKSGAKGPPQLLVIGWWSESYACGPEGCRAAP